jgi:hypothetical protein
LPRLEAPERKIHYATLHQAALIGSPGQRNDIAFAHELVEGLVAEGPFFAARNHTIPFRLINLAA